MYPLTRGRTSAVLTAARVPVRSVNSVTDWTSGGATVTLGGPASFGAPVVRGLQPIAASPSVKRRSGILRRMIAPLLSGTTANRGPALPRSPGADKCGLGSDVVPGEVRHGSERVRSLRRRGPAFVRQVSCRAGGGGGDGKPATQARQRTTRWRA